MSQRRASNKEARKVIAYALKHGFTIEKTSGHFKLRLGARTLTMACSPKCPHAYTHAMKDVQRIIDTRNENV